MYLFHFHMIVVHWYANTNNIWNSSQDFLSRCVGESEILMPWCHSSSTSVYMSSKEWADFLCADDVIVTVQARCCFCEGLGGNKTGPEDWQRTVSHLKQEVPEASGYDDIGALTNSAQFRRCINHPCKSSPPARESTITEGALEISHRPIKTMCCTTDRWSTYLGVSPAVGCSSLLDLTIVLQCGTSKWPLQVWLIEKWSIILVKANLGFDRELRLNVC